MGTFAVRNLHFSRDGFKQTPFLRVSPAGYHFYRERKTMYGIVEIQGQQFKVEAGQKIFVQHLKNVAEGDTVEFDRVMLLDNGGNVTVGAPTVVGAKVVCEVLQPLVKGEKVLVFHKKRRKGHRKLNGHRQQFTQVNVKEIVA